MADRPDFTVRVADERDVDALARLRRAWLEERAGRVGGAEILDPSFEPAFAQWWRSELPRRTFWIAETGTERTGFIAVGSLNVVEIVHMPRPGARGGAIGHVGNAFVIASWADRGVPRALLARAVAHARERRYRRLVLAPTPGSAPFYRRAGFAPAGETLLVLGPESAAPGEVRDRGQ